MIWVLGIYLFFFVYTWYLSKDEESIPKLLYPLITLLSPIYMVFVDLPERYRQLKVYRDNSYVSQLVKTLDFDNPEPVKFARKKTVYDFGCRVSYYSQLSVDGEILTLTEAQREYLDRRYFKYRDQKDKLEKQQTINKNEELARKALGHDKFVTNQIRKDYENLFPIQTIKNPPS